MMNYRIILVIVLTVLFSYSCDKADLLSEKDVSTGLSFLYDGTFIEANPLTISTSLYSALDSLYVYADIKHERFDYIRLALPLDRLNPDAELHDAHIDLACYYASGPAGGARYTLAEVISSVVRVSFWDEEGGITGNFTFQGKVLGTDGQKHEFVVTDGIFSDSIDSRY